MLGVQSVEFDLARKTRGRHPQTALNRRLVQVLSSQHRRNGVIPLLNQSALCRLRLAVVFHCLAARLRDRIDLEMEFREAITVPMS